MEATRKPDCSADIFRPDALLDYVPRSVGRLLDCGCGDGARGALIRARNGARVVGLERDPALAAEAKARLDEVVCLDPDSDALPFEDGAFPCVLCVDLIAQLRNPKPFLEEVARVVAPSGLLILTVPNLQFFRCVAMLAEGRWDYEQSGPLAHNHLRFFTAYEIVKLLKECGLETKRCGALVSVPEAELPLDASRKAKVGRVTMGPLDEDAYAALRTEQYIVFASRDAE